MINLFLVSSYTFSILFRWRFDTANDPPSRYLDAALRVNFANKAILIIA